MVNWRLVPAQLVIALEQGPGHAVSVNIGGTQVTIVTGDTPADPQAAWTEFLKFFEGEQLI